MPSDPKHRGDPHPDDPSIRIVPRDAVGPQAHLVQTSRSAPLADEIRLAGGDEAGFLRALQDVVVRELVVLDPVPQAVPRRFTPEVGERVDHEAYRGVAD